MRPRRLQTTRPAARPFDAAALRRRYRVVDSTDLRHVLNPRHARRPCLRSWWKRTSRRRIVRIEYLAILVTGGELDVRVMTHLLPILCLYPRDHRVGHGRALLGRIDKNPQQRNHVRHRTRQQHRGRFSNPSPFNSAPTASKCCCTSPGSGKVARSIRCTVGVSSMRNVFQIRSGTAR